MSHMIETQGIDAMMDGGPAFEAAVDQAKALRRHLHRHPELAFEEFATADLVAGSWRSGATR